MMKNIGICIISNLKEEQLKTIIKLRRKKCALACLGRIILILLTKINQPGYVTSHKMGMGVGNMGNRPVDRAPQER